MAKVRVFYEPERELLDSMSIEVGVAGRPPSGIAVFSS